MRRSSGMNIPCRARLLLWAGEDLLRLFPPDPTQEGVRGRCLPYSWHNAPVVSGSIVGGILRPDKMGLRQQFGWRLVRQICHFPQAVSCGFGRLPLFVIGH